MAKVYYNIKAFWTVDLILSSCPDSRVSVDENTFTFEGPKEDSDRAMLILKAVDTLEEFNRFFELSIEEDENA